MTGDRNAAANTDLRDAAEARLRAGLHPNSSAIRNSDQLRMLHELQVHQIELEMQNNELLQSRADLETALSRYTELYDFAPVGYITLTAAGLIAKINLTGAALLGMERISIINKNFMRFVALRDRERWRRQLSSMNNGGSGATELALQHANGAAFHAHLACMAHKVGAGGTDSGARAIEIRIAITDISLRKRIECERNEALVEAEKANSAKAIFLSNMSHELRTPLNAVLGFAQLIESGSPTPPQKRSIDQVLKAGWRLLELIDEIIDRASTGSESAPLRLETLNLAELLHECRLASAAQAQNRGIAIKFPALHDPLFVVADRMRLKEILVKLLSNAIDDSPASGTVAVSCCGGGGGRIRIGIEDSGRGLSAEQLAQLFRSGNHSDIKPDAGLAMCKRLIESLGGAIGATSTPGAGSTFWIELDSVDALP